MIYNVSTEKKLEPVYDVSPTKIPLAFRAEDDIRNYAVTICYRNGFVEQILRSDLINFHKDILAMLRLTSEVFSKYATEESVKEPYHTTIDTTLSKNNHLAIYMSIPSLSNRNLLGYICLPKDLLNDAQKNYLRERESYLSFFPPLEFSKYNEETGLLEDFDKKKDPTGTKTLKKILER